MLATLDRVVQGHQPTGGGGHAVDQGLGVALAAFMGGVGARVVAANAFGPLVGGRIQRGEVHRVGFEVHHD